jgi:hypothetical protein
MAFGWGTYYFSIITTEKAGKGVTSVWRDVPPCVLVDQDETWHRGKAQGETPRS